MTGDEQPTGAGIAALMREELEARDPRHVGEIDVAGPRQQLPPHPQPLERLIPRPDWNEEERQRLQREAAAERERVERQAAAEAARKLQAEIEAAEQPETLPKRRGWKRREKP